MTANTHSRLCSSAYSGPPMKISARPDRAATPATVTAPMTSTAPRLIRCICLPASRLAMNGKAITTTNWGRNSTALARISPPAYRPAWCSLSALRAITTSAFDSAKNASRAWELCIVSRSTPSGAQRCPRPAEP